jgi:Icc-related predicted phosphoesterase
MKIKVLSVSDIELGFIYSPQIRDRFGDADIVLSCGDLPYFYLEYIVSMLDVPLYYVRGNHAHRVEATSHGDRTEPWGCRNLHRQVVRDDSGLLLAGIEGSIRYNSGPYQYTQSEMWLQVLSLVPGLVLNKLRYGRYLDIFICHSPPWHIHDKDDPPHRGIKAFNWLIKVFKPLYVIHGHIHIYRSDEVILTGVGNTKVLNTFGYKELALDYDYLTVTKHVNKESGS